MWFRESKIYCPYLVALFLLGCPLVHAQELVRAQEPKTNEARGLLKRLESYENKYLAPQDTALKEKPAVKKDSSNVLAKQQEVLISEVLRLRSQVSQLESQIAQGQEKADFSQEEQKLIGELTKERKRGDDLERELALEKEKDYDRLNRELENAKSAVATERQNADRKEKLLKEVSEQVTQLEDKLQQQQELKKALTKVRNESEQMQLQLEAQKGIESDNQFLRQSLAEERQKGTDIIKKSKELVQTITSLKGEHSVLQTETSQCQGQLKAGDEELKRLQSVEKELIAARNELMLKDTTSELLAAGPSKRQREIRAKANQSVQEQTMDSATQKKYIETKLAFESAQKALAGASSGAEMPEVSTGEARVVTVVGTKVNLRNGPGMEHSPVMQVSEGSKLTMETKEGEWYRVYTPTGSRAYIHQAEVSFGGLDTGSIVSPAKAPLRREELEPFGKVKVAGAIDTEDLAIRKLKASIGGARE